MQDQKQSNPEFYYITEKMQEAYDIIEHSPVTVFLWKNAPGWPVEFVTENVEELFGYTSREFKSGAVSYMNILHPDDVQRVAQEVREHSQNKETQHFTQEYRIISKKGMIKWLDDRTYIRRDETGNITHYQGIVIDITERKYAENLNTIRALQHAVVVELGQQALAGEDLPVLMNAAVMKAARVLHADYCKILEFLPERKIFFLKAGVGWNEGLVGEALIEAGLDSQAGYTLCSDTPVIVEDLRTETRFNGPPLLHDHHVISGMSVLIRGEDHPFGVMGVHTKEHRIFTEDDVHFLQSVANILAQSIQRHQAEEEIRLLNEELEQRVIERTAQLEAVNHELKEFAYVISHDLKAPFSSISRLAAWIKNDYQEILDETGKQHLTLLIGRVKRIDAFIDGLLEYSRIGRIQTEECLVDLHDVVIEVLETLAPPSHIEVIIEEPLPVIRKEKIRMTQIFQNLLSNAIKYNNEPQGKIRISCEETESAWLFKVADNGPGIEAKYHEKVFQIFQTLHSRDKIESTGIGLTLVKKIIDVYGGKIWIESTPGQGSTFLFTLPK